MEDPVCDGPATQCSQKVNYEMKYDKNYRRCNSTQMPEKCDNNYEAKVNKAIEYCSNILHRYFFKIGLVQEKVYNAWKALIDKDFNFAQEAIAEKHVELMTVLADAYATDFSGSPYIKLVWEFWIAKLHMKGLKTLSAEHRTKMEIIGRILASLLIVNAEYQKAATVLHDIVGFNSKDIASRLVMLKLAAQLGEWEVLEKLLQDENKLPSASGEQKGLLQLFELLHRVHTQSNTISSDEIIACTEKYISTKFTTYIECEACVVAEKIRIAASRLPHPDLTKIGDPIANRTRELRSSAVLVKSRIPSFFLEKEKNLLLRRYYKTEELQKLMTTEGSTSFLKSCSNLAIFFDTSQSNIVECLECGLLKEATSSALSYWRDALRLCVPIHLLRATALNVRVWQHNPEVLRHAKNSVEVLFSRNVEKESTKKESPRKVLSRTQNKSTKDSSSSSLEPHKKDCSCLLCSSSSFSTTFLLEMNITKLIYALYNNKDCEKFYPVWKQEVIPRFTIENTAFRSQFPGLNSNLLNANQSAAYVDAIARWAMTLLPQHVAKPKVQKLITEALEHACRDVVSMRSNWLLLKQLTRLHEPAKALLADKENVVASIERSLNSLSIDQSGTPARGRAKRITRATKNYVELSEEVLATRDEDFQDYNHLMLREWRTRTCCYLTQHCVDPFEKAYYLAEASLCGVRQLIKAHYAREEETYYHKSVDEFRHDVADIPEDLTVVQLFVDHNKMLWFSRLHSKLLPFTVPIADLNDSSVMERMQDLLEKNKETTNNRDSKTFWKSRKAVDQTLKGIIENVQNEWFGSLVHFLLPYSEKLPSTYVTQLAKTGLSKDSCKSLICAAGCANAKEEWLPLVKLVCDVERISFDSVLSIASTCYDKLDSVQREAIDIAVKDKFTILNIAPELSCIQFESMPFLRDYPLVCRIPSFKLFCNLINNVDPVPKPINGRKSYFVLNAGGDLPDTEKRLAPVVESYKFDGIKGIVPESAQISAVLNKYDVFFYIGHGSGGRYFGRNIIRSSKCRAVPILMGCDSAAIILEGPGFDGKSAIYDYLIARCPCVVGCLWMVTDGEIDRYFVALLDYCFSHLQAKSIEDVADKITTKRGYRTLLRGIANAREKCHLQYLTGGAVVAYGLPVVSQIV
ncbi:hypothetical protein QR680_003002 [Steinernema hermaphroditum]|uniref:separase n=1 Tax=Steinernema hermaphroditum TaxID=289476 RepID=A0AA39LJF6_9BILA|nr:hypothetical protein QR680_003002 [Steinernema hermaphroditum]